MFDGELYFKRQKNLRGEYPDVYKYDILPHEFKVQTVHIWRNCIGYDHYTESNSSRRKLLRQSYDLLCEELGVFELTKNETILYNKVGSYLDNIQRFFLLDNNTEVLLSVIELMTKIIQQLKGVDSLTTTNIISKLNRRFKEHGIGYQYEASQIIRIDSEFIHSEVVKHTLALLSNPLYRGAEEEFLEAHNHFRHSNYADVLSECLKSFESTMLAICDKHDWNYNKKANANTLVNICMENGLIPTFWLDHFNSLRNILTSSVATPRNKLDGHGQGNQKRVVPDYLAAYVLHMTASTIVFLAKAEETLV